MPIRSDEDAALAAIASLNVLSAEQQDAQARIASLTQGKENDAFVDIHELFALYNVLYFRSLLVPRVEVSWRPRLTLSAGMCELTKDDEGNYRRICLKMSEPLLKYRSRSDTINTLLHEAIHAYLLVTTGWRHSRGADGTGHGTGFLLLADAISNHGGYNITVYHSFHDEVDSYRTHVWKCDGPCQNQEPFFGLVKRSMNRPPSKNDPWWTKHEEECGGTYSKISEPGPTKAQLNVMSAQERAGRQKNKIDGWVQKPISNNEPDTTKAVPLVDDIVPDNDAVQISADPAKAKPQGLKRWLLNESSEAVSPKRILVGCPICNERMDQANINLHLDTIHGF